MRWRDCEGIHRRPRQEVLCGDYYQRVDSISTHQDSVTSTHTLKPASAPLFFPPPALQAFSTPALTAPIMLSNDSRYSVDEEVDEGEGKVVERRLRRIRWDDSISKTKTGD